MASTSVLQIPDILPEKQCKDPPLCPECFFSPKKSICSVTTTTNQVFVYHTSIWYPSCPLVCKRETPNQGRSFYTCCWPKGRKCSFFRWRDENEQFSEIIPRSPLLTLNQVLQETESVDADLRQQAWAGLQQGTEEWMRIRSCHLYPVFVQCFEHRLYAE